MESNKIFFQRINKRIQGLIKFLPNTRKQGTQYYLKGTVILYTNLNHIPWNASGTE